ncbi:MAG: hypothetical protein FWH27_15650, partial [Planctomycetaceae bacterium]|nr:hypothetical protein [Planctomycetaceae bacterium]
MRTRAEISCSIPQSRDGHGAVIPLDHLRGSDGKCSRDDCAAPEPRVLTRNSSRKRREATKWSGGVMRGGRGRFPPKTRSFCYVTLRS